MARKLIIDADPGIGDALAITLAMLDPEVDVLALTATAGCVTGETATRNVQAIVELLDPAKRPRIGGSNVSENAFTADAETKVFDLSRLHGRTGMGENQFRVAELHAPRESAKLMVDLVRDQPHQITLLTLGPLTNVGLANERAPDFLGLLKGLVCCGGSVTVGGNVTSAAELNMFANPLAARNVLQLPATKTLVPLDISDKAVLTFDAVNALASASPRFSWLFNDVLPFHLRMHHQLLGHEVVCLHEVIALAAATHPELFTTEGMCIDVETRGELTRGMTVFDRRRIDQWQTNIDVIVNVDGNGVLDYMSQIIRQAS